MVINGALREIVNKFFLKSFDTNFIGSIKSHQRNNFFLYISLPMYHFWVQ